MHRTKVTVVEEALDANNTIASANRLDFDRAAVKVINFMGAPGAGKTTLLERVVTSLPGLAVGVLEGDVQGSMDADRLASLHVPVTQINTAAGFGGSGRNVLEPHAGLPAAAKSLGEGGPAAGHAVS